MTNHAGVFGTGLQSFLGEPLNGGDLGHERRPSLGLWPLLARWLFACCGRNGCQHLTGGDRVAGLQSQRLGHHARAGGLDFRLHLHGGDHEQGVASGNGGAFAGAHLNHGAGHGALDGDLAFLNGQGRRLRGLVGCRNGCQVQAAGPQPKLRLFKQCQRAVLAGSIGLR